MLSGPTRKNAAAAVTIEKNTRDNFHEMMGSVFLVTQAPMNDPGTMRANTKKNITLTSNEEAPSTSTM